MSSKIQLLLLFAVACLSAKGQHTVVMDLVTRTPVGQASLYTRDASGFHSAISRADGSATVGFAFRRLTVSHLNYERRQLSSLPDTVWLKPRFRSTPEVVVKSVEPEWIRPFLKKVIKQKELHYFSRPDTLAYRYGTQSISTSQFYRYDATGLLASAKGRADYRISHLQGLISASDSTKLTDMMNMRRMLYEDFVLELDAAFLRKHVFSVNHDYEGASSSEVELAFRLKKGVDDRGRMVVDTVRNVVLSVWRKSGTAYNRSNRMSSMLYRLSQLVNGYGVDEWYTDHRIIYREHQGRLFPADVHYKSYVRTHEDFKTDDQQEFSRQTGGGFPNMEATLLLLPPDSLENAVLLPGVPVETAAPASASTFFHLPESWYIRMADDQRHIEDISLSHMPSYFKLAALPDE